MIAIATSVVSASVPFLKRDRVFSDRKWSFERDHMLRTLVADPKRLTIRRAHQERTGRCDNHLGTGGAFLEVVLGLQQPLLRRRQRLRPRLGHIGILRCNWILA